MYNFSDREDRHLVQLAVVYGDQQQRISWAQVAEKMKYSGKDSRTLWLRLATLKHTHSKTLRDFPAWFFKPPTSRLTSPARPPRRSVSQSFEPERTGESPQCWARVPTASISAFDTYVVLQRIFGHVRKKDVYWHRNCFFSAIEYLRAGGMIEREMTKHIILAWIIFRSRPTTRTFSYFTH